MILNYNLLPINLRKTSVDPLTDLSEVLESFHFNLGRYYDITIIPTSNSLIKGSPLVELIEEGSVIALVVNRSGYFYRINSDIDAVIGILKEKFNGIEIAIKKGPKYDLIFISFDIINLPETDKEKKNLIKKRKKTGEILTEAKVEVESETSTTDEKV